MNIHDAPSPSPPGFPRVGFFLCVGLFLSLTVAGFLGCGSPASDVSYPAREPASPEFMPADEGSGLAFRSAATAPSEGGDADVADFEADAVETVDAEQFARKLIQTADASLVVEDFDSVPDRVESLVRQHRGFIASSRIGGHRGDRRTGTWQVRVPAEHFEPFLAAATGIGEVRSIHRKSQDVTEEFFDVEARIRNKKVQEGGLLKILEERPGKLEDVLAVERELSRVREEMERMQGRLRLLANLTALATVNLEVEEIKGYIPPESPTLARRVSRSFDGSLFALRVAAENLLVAVVALVPWLVTLGILGLPFLLVVRRLGRPRAGRKQE